MKTILIFLTAIIGLSLPATASAREHHRGHSHHQRHSSSHHSNFSRSYAQSSGYYVTRVVGYNECGRPIYRRFWVSTCAPVRPYYSYGQGGYCR